MTQTNRVILLKVIFPIAWTVIRIDGRVGHVGPLFDAVQIGSEQPLPSAIRSRPAELTLNTTIRHHSLLRSNSSICFILLKSTAVPPISRSLGSLTPNHSEGGAPTIRMIALKIDSLT